MALKTVLSVIGADHSDLDLKTAIGVCDEIGAHLSLLIVHFSLPPPIGEYSGAESQAWLEKRARNVARLKARAEEVKTLLAVTGLSCDVGSDYCETASVDDVVRWHALYADLTMVGSELLADEQLRSPVLNGSLFESGKPVLVVPERARATLRPKRVLVGWDSRVEASRAVREALELLSGAEEVCVTLVDPEATDRENGAEPGADIGAYLARHGVRVTVDRLPSAGHSVARVLTSHAVDTSADMIVMGAYGHSRLLERIFGGVTRSMLEKPLLPLFLAR